LLESGIKSQEPRETTVFCLISWFFLLDSIDYFLSLGQKRAQIIYLDSWLLILESIFYLIPDEGVLLLPSF